MTPSSLSSDPNALSSSVHLSDAQPILTVDRLTKQFASAAVPAVDGVTFTLQPGALLALLGPSGCGKTTLLRLIAGFEQPQQGTIRIAQRVVAGAGQWIPPERRDVGMVFQDYALFPHLTVRQNIEFGLTQSRKPKQTIADRVQEVIALVGLSGLEARYPHQLSGGQQQRVALARALAPHPFLILLDEPLSNLDIQVRLRLRQELRDILKAAGTSAILVTHDQEEALSIADQVAVLQAGHIEQLDTPEQIYQAPASRFVADFVTQANLLPAQRQGDLWTSEMGHFPVEQVSLVPADRLLDQVDQGDLMIRQEWLQLQPDEMSPILIRDRQFLGREYRYSLQLPSGQALIARLPITTQLAVGTPVQITVCPGNEELRLIA